MKRSVIFLLAVLAVLPSLDARAAFRVEVTDENVTAAGATPGGSVAAFAVTRQWNNLSPFAPLRTREAWLRTASSSGVAILTTMPPRRPRLGTWFAVDIGSGDWDVAGTLEFPPNEIELDVAPAVAGGTDVSAALPEMHVLLVRPGANGGAWSIYAAKTSALDLSSGNAPLKIALSSFKPVGTSPPSPPASFQAGDVLLLLDPSRMLYSVTEVAP